MKINKKILTGAAVSTVVLLAVIFQTGIITRVRGEENEGYPPSDAYTLMYEDEFNGTDLNKNDWVFRTGERLGGLNRPENVRIADGKLNVDFRKEVVDGKEWYTSGGIISKNLFGYGYYEVKSKLYGGTGGLHSSFWLMGTNYLGDGVNYPKYNQIIEIDGYEVDSHRPERVAPNLHYYIGRHIGVGGVEAYVADTSADYVVHGFEWLPNKIRWYVNGKMVRELENPEFFGPQNLWLTALGCPGNFGGTTDDTKLPGVSNWEYFKFYARDLVGANLLGNSNFEFNTNKDYEKGYKYNVQIPVAWIESGDADASLVVETNNSYDGDCILKHQRDSSYKVETKQNLQFISNGLYTLTAMVRSSGGQKEAKMKISGDGIKGQYVDIAGTGSTWTKITIDDIKVDKGVCTVSFYSDADAGQWLEIDDVVFSMKSGNTDINLEMNLPVKSYEYPGAIIVDEADTGKYMESGTWTRSSLKGYIGTSKYSNNMKAFAQWTTAVPLSADYKVYFYNIGYDNNIPRAKLAVTYNGETATKEIVHKTTESGWADLGTYNFKSGDTVSVKLTPGDGVQSGYFRADCIKLVPEKVLKIKDALVMMIDNNIAYKSMNKVKVEKTNPDVRPFIENGQVLVPAGVLSEYFDLKDGKAIPDGSEFLPLKTVEEVFGKKAFYDEKGLIIISDYESILDSEDDEGIINEIIAEFF